MMLNSLKKRFAGIPLLLVLAGLLVTPAVCVFLDATSARAADIPEWVHNFKISGDLRLRYNGMDENADGNKRRRYRIRFRPGVTAKITDQWSVGFGLATGGSDLRSTNQNISEFSTYDIRLDYAYALYSPCDHLAITAGKMKTPFWKVKDLIWDSDNRPDGVAANLTFGTSDSISWFVTPAMFVLGEYRESKEDEAFEMMQLIQGGFNAEFNETSYLKLAATAYMFNDIEPGSFAESAGTNTEMIESAYTVDAEFGYTGAPIFIGAFGQYVASDAHTDETGYLLGVKFGDKSVKSFGQWQMKYNYRSLEANAFHDFLMDSDAMGGSTGIQGSEIEAVVGLAKNVTFGIDYYMMEDKLNKEELDLIQIDLVLKF